MSRLALVIGLFATALVGAENKPKNIKEYVLGGGSVGSIERIQTQIKNNAVTPVWGNPNSNQIYRSKGAYIFDEIRVGESVIRMQGKTILDEWLDFDLTAPKKQESAKSEEPIAQAARLESTKLEAKTSKDSNKDPAVQAAIQAALKAALPVPVEVKAIANAKKHDSQILLKIFKDKFGEPAFTYNKPSDKSSIGHTILSWRSQNSDGKTLLWRLQLFYSSDNQFMTGQEPFYARLQISLPLSIDELIFNRNLFTIKPDELREHFAAAGVTFTTPNEHLLPKGLFGAKASINIISSVGRLQMLEVNFHEKIPLKGSAIQRTKDEFTNNAYEAISQRLRSAPAEVKSSGPRYITTEERLYDPTTGRYFIGTTTKPVATGPSFVWSPRGSPNYRLIGAQLQIIPPGFQVARALDPLAGGVNSMPEKAIGSEMPDFNLPSLDFSELKANVQKDGKGSIWLDIPMENQGELPFCFPASLARIMRYHGIQVNQFAVATAGGVDMRGTNWPKLVTMVGNCCSKFGMLVRGMNRSEKLSDFVKQAIDKGQPVLWLVPGHARIINGYNQTTGSVYYTDSWGEGFERLSMPYIDAEPLTEFAFIFLPPAAIKEK